MTEVPIRVSQWTGFYMIASFFMKGLMNPIQLSTILESNMKILD